MDIALELISVRSRLEQIEKAFIAGQAVSAQLAGARPSTTSTAMPDKVKQSQTPAPAIGAECVCSDCGKPVSRKVMAFSLRRFDDVYCFECQKKHTAEGGMHRA